MVCGASAFKGIFKKTLLKCASCGFVTANTEIDQQRLREIYTEGYFHGEEYLDYLKDKEAIQKNFRQRLKYILKERPKESISHILELGCAYGFFAEVAKKELPKASYIGLDVVPGAVHYGRNTLNLNLIEANYLEYPTEAPPYSDVFMWDVIEHLAAPHLFLEKLSTEMQDNGYLYITTGDIGTWLARVRGPKWRMIHPPSHLHYFDTDTISRLLNRCGFEITNITYPPVYRSLKQIYYSLFLLNKKSSKLHQSIFTKIPSSWSIPINTFDIMFIMAKKVALLSGAQNTSL